MNHPSEPISRRCSATFVRASRKIIIGHYLSSFASSARGSLRRCRNSVSRVDAVTPGDRLIRVESFVENMGLNLAGELARRALTLRLGLRKECDFSEQRNYVRLINQCYTLHGPAVSIHYGRLPGYLYSIKISRLISISESSRKTIGRAPTLG